MPGDLAPRRATMISYESTWQARGAALAEELKSVLGSPARRVDHIGSTAIPGMAAKRGFDMQVSVDDLDEAARAFDGPLTAWGFDRLPYERDHVPAGYPDDPAGSSKRLWTRRGGPEEDVNLHVRLQGAPNERPAPLFRDWFRAHPEAVPAFARFKRVLARSAGDVYTYTDVKDPVVDLVAVVAES